MLAKEIFEVSMKPSSLEKNASSTKARVGIEFEMYIPLEEIDDLPEFESLRDVKSFVSRANSSEAVDKFIQYVQKDFRTFAYDEFTDEDQDDILELVGDSIDPEDYTQEQLFNEWFEIKSYEIFPKFTTHYSGLRDLNDYVNTYNEHNPINHITIQSPDALKNEVNNLARSLGVEISTSRTVTHYGDSDVWTAKPDASLRSHYDGYDSIEVVSPPLPWNETKQYFQKLLSHARNYDYITDKTTGLHINVSVPNIENLDYMKLVLFLGDNHILENFGRLANDMCESVFNKIESAAGNHAHRQSSLIPTLLDLLSNKQQKLASTIFFNKNTDKYVSINLHNGANKYVEFRSPGGDWMSDHTPTDLVNTVNRFIFALEIASEPNAYRNEYYKKLYKLFSFDQDNGSLYAKYQSGMISKPKFFDMLMDKRNKNKSSKNEWKLFKNNQGEVDPTVLAVFKGSNYMDIKPKAISWVMRNGEDNAKYVVQDPVNRFMQFINPNEIYR